jgi:hypothetical protein
MQDIKDEFILGFERATRVVDNLKIEEPNRTLQTYKDELNVDGG